MEGDSRVWCAVGYAFGGIGDKFLSGVPLGKNSIRQPLPNDTMI